MSGFFVFINTIFIKFNASPFGCIHISVNLLTWKKIEWMITIANRRASC